MIELLGSVGPPSDAELIGAVRSGDAQAYGVLYERHAPAASRLASYLVGGGADSDDVVAEAFARVLRAIRGGGGPAEAFRPYLVTVVRRVAWDQIRGQRTQIPTDAAEFRDPGEPFVDPAVATLEHSLIARAFRSLPERWTAVLWHTEIEQAETAEVALLLGLTPNGVAALRYRAREGLRQAYLQMHLSAVVGEQCRTAAAKLGGYVRGTLSTRDASKVRDHLHRCAGCRAAHSELENVNQSLRGLVAPIFLGGAAAAYLSAGGGHAAASIAAAGSSAGGSAPHWSAGLHWLMSAARHRPHIPAVAGVLTAVVAVSVITGQQAGPHSSRASAPAWPGSGVTGTPGHSPASPLASGAGMPSASASNSAAPSESAATARPAQLSVSVQVNGLLGLGLTAVVVLNVTDVGPAPTAGLTASLRLPAGLELLGGLNAGAWRCSAGGSGVTTCTHGPLGAGATATASFRILALSLTGCGSAVLASVTSGVLSAAGQSAAIQCKGLL